MMPATASNTIPVSMEKPGGGGGPGGGGIT